MSALAEAVFKKARRDGCHEPREAYLADARVALATSEGLPTHELITVGMVIAPVLAIVTLIEHTRHATEVFLL